MTKKGGMEEEGGHDKEGGMEEEGDEGGRRRAL